MLHGGGRALEDLRVIRQDNGLVELLKLEFIEYCIEQMPKGKRIAALRADSAAYQAAIFNWCEADVKRPVRFAIGAESRS